MASTGSANEKTPVVELVETLHLPEKLEGASPFELTLFPLSLRKGVGDR
jgi:hypothetical protein